MCEPAADVPSRPFTPRTFRRSVDEFDRLMAQITRKDDDSSPDERRQFIAGALLRHFRSLCAF